MFGRGLRWFLPLVAIAVGLWLAFHPNVGWVFRLHLSQLLHPADKGGYWEAIFGGSRSDCIGPGACRSFLTQLAQRHPDDFRLQLSVRLLTSSSQDEQALLDMLPRFGDRAELLAHILRLLAPRIAVRRHETQVMNLRVHLPWQSSFGGPLGAPPRMVFTPRFSFPPSSEYERWFTWDRRDLYGLWMRLFVPLPPSQEELALYKAGKNRPARLATFIRLAQRGEQLDPDNAFFPAMLAAAYFAQRKDTEAIEALLRASRKTRWEDYTSSQTESLIYLYTLVSGKPLALSLAMVCSMMEFRHDSVLVILADVAKYAAYLQDVEGNTSRGAEIRLAVLRLGSLMRSQAHYAYTAHVGTDIHRIAIQLLPELSIEEVLPFSSVDAQHRQFAEHLRRLGRVDEVKWVSKELQTDTLARDIVRKGAVKVEPVWKLVGEIGNSWRNSFRLLMLTVVLTCLWLACVVAERFLRGHPLVAYAALPMTLLIAFVWLRRSDVLSFTVELWLGARWFMEDRELPDFLVSILSFLRQHLGSFGPYALDARQISIAWVGSTAFATLFVVGVLSLPDLIRGQPIHRAVVDGMRRNGLLVASLLFLLYVWNAWNVASMEQRASDVLQQLLYREPQYYAQLLGTKWPD